MTGPPSLVDSEGDPVPGLGPGKTLALLCYLAREGDVSRDEATHMLWGGLDDDRARNAFRQALHRLRRSLGEEAIPHDRERVRLEGEDLVEVDVDAFERALAAGRIEEALEHYSGDFLEGLDTGEVAFEHWADRERALLRARAEEAMGRAVDGALADGDAERALEWARRRAEHAPYDAEAALAEAEVLVTLGRSAEARAALDRFRGRHEADIGSDAPPEVRDTLARLDAEERAVGTGAMRSGTGGLDGGPREADPRPADPRARPGSRAAATARLLAAWRGLRAGEGATIALEGEDGARRAVVEEFLSRVRALGPVLVLRGRERLDGGEGLPYAPVAEALRCALDAPGLAGASSPLLAEASRIVPELRDQFDLPDHGPIDEEAARHRLFEGTAELVDAVAYEQPVFLVLDGVDRSPASTRELVRYLSGRLREIRVLLLLLLDRMPAEWPDAGGGIERIALESTESKADRPDTPVDGTNDGRRRSWRRVLPWAVGAALALAALALGLAWPRSGPPGGGHVLRDTVVLVQPRGEGSAAGGWAASGPLQTASERLARTTVADGPDRPGPAPAFPWMNANPAPAGGDVAVERMSAQGPDLYVVRAESGDTVPVATGPGDHLFLDWSPDGRRLLVVHGRQRPDGGYETDLLVHSVDDPTRPAPIDTLGVHAVSDGSFSPDGRRVAWTARAGARGLRDVFVAPAEGGAVRDVTAHPADDFGPVWSPDGERIAFVSTRDGNLEIYAVVLETGEVWRLTWDEARDGDPAFSPDGEFLAFESNREGVRGVWVVSSWGGEPVRVSRPGEPSRLAGWR